MGNSKYYSNRSEILKFVLILILLIITPLLSKSLRFKYLYFIVNILIVSLGAEAGLLSFFLESTERKTKHNLIALTARVEEKRIIVSKNVDIIKSSTTHEHVEEPVDDDVQQQPRSGIFFIDNGENDNAEEEGCVRDQEDEEDHNDEGDRDSTEMSGQELFQKAETFIGDFYKQLKMQREESRNKLHTGS